MDCVGRIPDASYYGVNEMSESEKRDFVLWLEGQKSEIFDNRCVLETYTQDDVTVLRQAFRVFMRTFVQIGNIEVFLEAITIASACNKIFRANYFHSVHFQLGLPFQ